MADLVRDVPVKLVVGGGQLFSYLVMFGSTSVFLQVKADAHSSEVVAQVNEALAMLGLCFRTSEDLTS
jgi:hypothetical protein